MKKTILLLILSLSLINTAKAKILDLDYFVLDNGLEVAVIENNKAPIALQMLYYKTGSVNDPKSKGGIAHLLEHMMFRGTKHTPKQMFNELTKEYGAENNAFTTYDITAYHQLVDISKLELMLALEAERMQNLNLDSADFLTERDVVLEERMQRFETNPVPQFYEMINKLLWQDNPYANPVSGSIEDIKSLQLEDAQEFYNKYYTPNNALLILAGNLTTKEAKIIANKHYGNIPSGQKLETPKQDKPKNIDIKIESFNERVQTPRYVQYIRLDDTFSKKEILALSFFSLYLTGDDTSYLYDKLIYQDKSLLSVYVSVDYDDNYGGKIGIYASPIDDAQTLDEISKLIALGYTSGFENINNDDIQRIKNESLSSTLYIQENPESAANFVGNLLLAGYTQEEIINYDNIIADITLDDVKNVWQKVLQQKSKVIGVLRGKSKDNANE